LFLDEIGDMPWPFQAKLLRVLQEREVRPVGSTEAVPIDVRVVSATHQNLPAAIDGKTFRDDLYYRLNVVSLELPPLARRREDIPLLARHFLEVFRSRMSSGGTDVRGFSAEAMEALIVAGWPGNIRQLRNVVEQCAVLSTKPLIPVSLVERALQTKANAFLTFAQAHEHFERDYLKRLLTATRGNVAKAARLAKRNRSQFYRLLNKHELDPESFRGCLEGG
jgi:two-component system response regulator GlrR